MNLTSDFSPETPEDKVGIYENKAYGTEALYANMERSERPEPIMEPERIPVDDLHVRLHNKFYSTANTICCSIDYESLMFFVTIY